jgi:simple sugar transport system permease protein
LFGALLQGTSTRNLDPAVFDPSLAQNLTIIIQGLVVLFVTANVVIIWLVGRFRRSRVPAEARS